MKIDNLSACNSLIVYRPKLKMTTFKSSFRSVYDNNFSLKYNTNTCFFRSDLKWGEFVDYLNKKYENTDKVNVIDYACSSGEEPNSLAMILDFKLGSKANKFFPIQAFDIDEDNIEQAEKGLFGLNKGELELIENNIGDKYKEYFDLYNDEQGKPILLSSKENLKSKITYKQSDIKKDFFRVPSKNTVLFCRNFIPYLKIGEEMELVKNIAQHLQSSSLVVLGHFEISYGIEKLFEKAGFKHTSLYNVMEKLPYHKALMQNALCIVKH